MDAETILNGNISSRFDGGDDQQGNASSQQSDHDYEHPEQSGDPYKFGDPLTKSQNPDGKQKR